MSAGSIKARGESISPTHLTIKKRGIRLDEDTLRRELRVGRKAGDGASATVVLTRVAGKQAALIVELAS